MQVKNTVIIALVAGMVTLVSCNKGGGNVRVKKITSNKGVTTEFFYTPDNKILSTKNSDSTKVSYTYTGNTIVQLAANPTNGQSMSETMHVGASGYVDSTTVTDPRSGVYLTTNSHDADGYNTLTKDYLSGELKRVTTSVFKDGNEVSRTISNEKSEPIGTVYFEYFTDKQNSLAPENLGMKFIGKDSKNLMKRVVQVLAKGDTIGTATFTYKFDDKGRVSEKSTFDKEGKLEDSSTITYY